MHRFRELRHFCLLMVISVVVMGAARDRGRFEPSPNLSNLFPIRQPLLDRTCLPRLRHAADLIKLFLAINLLAAVILVSGRNERRFPLLRLYCTKVQ